MKQENKNLLEFGEFRLDAEKLILWHADEIVQLQPKAAAILASLISRRGDVVSKDELMEEVWSDSFVEETNLSRNIHDLRKILSRCDNSQDYIGTVPRRGYRFLGDIRETENGDDELIIEREVFEQTLIEQRRDDPLEDAAATPLPAFAVPARRSYLIFAASAVLITALAFSAWYFNFGINQNLQAAKNPPTAVAILPFQSLDKQDEAFRLGITENLVSRLGGLERLVVRPTATVNRLSETETDPIEIGRKLKSDVVITGNFQHDGSRLRLFVRLLNVADGVQIWSGNFDESETDIFKLQDLLSAQIAGNLSSQLTPREQAQLAERSTEDFEAYKLYLRGRYAWNKRTKESLTESINYFRSAIDRDPTFALAYVGLADSYVIFNDYAVAPPSESFPKAKAAAFKALEIDPTLSEPRATLAYILAMYEWNFQEAEREYRREFETKPNYATAHQWYGEMLYATGRFAEAEIELKRAAELDPLAPIIQSEIGVVMYYSRRYDDAIAQFNKLKQDFPQFPTSYVFLSRCFEQKRMYDESFTEEIIYWKLQGIDEKITNGMENAFRQGGRQAYLEFLTGWLETAVQTKYVYEYRITHAYARQQNREKTLEWMEKGVENHSASIVKVFIDPNFDFLREEPRYQTVLKKMNLS